MINVTALQVFSNGLLGNCLKSGVKSIFCTGRIGSFADNLFWGELRPDNPGAEFFAPIFVDILKFSVKIYDFFSMHATSLTTTGDASDPSEKK